LVIYFSLLKDKFEVGRHWKSQNPAPKPVLCLHGWKDNAASFDRLIPHLISSPLKGGPYEFICIDFPGHGFSSHYPPGMTYKGLDSYTWLIRVSEHFGWGKETKLNIIGHAMGAIFGFLFASTHLSRVQNLVS
jgi:pimeloyl-ACP methyl ester carboxylesterase